MHAINTATAAAYLSHAQISRAPGGLSLQRTWGAWPGQLAGKILVQALAHVVGFRAQALAQPPMALRINCSIPDALAERMEPYKDLISPSELMQNALTERLDQLEAQASAASDADRIKACIASFTQNREPRYIKAARKAVEWHLSTERGVHSLLTFYAELQAVNNGESDREGMESLIHQFADDDLKTWEQKELFIKEFAEMAIDRLSDLIDEETQEVLL